MRNCAIITVDILNRIDNLFEQDEKELLDILILNQKSDITGTDIYLINYNNYEKIKNDGLKVEDLMLETRKEESVRNEYFIFRKISHNYLHQFSNKFNLKEKIKEKGIVFLTAKDLPFMEEKVLNIYKDSYMKKELDNTQLLMSILLHLLIHIFYALEEEYIK